MLSVERYKKGTFIGDTNEYFEENKSYRGKFDVYTIDGEESCIMICHSGKVYKSSPLDWAFQQEWRA